MNTTTESVAGAVAQHVNLPVYRLSCGGGGALTLERQLAKTPGVIRAYVNPTTEMAYVDYDPTHVDADELRGVIARAGYGPFVSR